MNVFQLADMSAVGEEQVVDTGRLRLLFGRRLSDDWQELAAVLGIAAHEWRRFPRGRQGDAIWDWLQDRERLQDLPVALKAVGRGDLADEFSRFDLGGAAFGAAFGAGALDATEGSHADPAKEAEFGWLNQTRFSALVAKHEHGHRLARRRLLIGFLDVAALLVLLCLAGAAAGGSAGDRAVAAGAAGLAALLIVTRSSVDRPDRTARHVVLRSQNLRIASEIQEILHRRARDPAQLSAVRRMQERLDDEDGSALGEASARHRQHAYREALKEFYDNATATCPECGASPWNRPKWYVRHRCPLCGNEPVTRPDDTPDPSQEDSQQ